VARSEIETLAAAVGMPVPEFEQAYIRPAGARKSLVELPNGDCIFYDRQQRRCQVYAARPRQCRNWPFWESNLRTPERWQETCRACPGSGRGRLAPLDEIVEQKAMIDV
jgi:Fe-S-cluster containining protein